MMSKKNNRQQQRRSDDDDDDGGGNNTSSSSDGSDDDSVSSVRRREEDEAPAPAAAAGAEQAETEKEGTAKIRLKTSLDNDEFSSTNSLPSKKKAKTASSSSSSGMISTALSTTPLDLSPPAPAVGLLTSGAGVATSSSSSNNNKPIIVVLDQASLETYRNKRGVYELLNCDDHREYCKRKLRRDPNDFRPDILHQEMLALLDSPLNKAGLLKLYVSTTKNVLIDVHPSLRMPRTYKRFAGLMVQLLHKMKIKAGNDSTTLLKVIKNPVSRYLPAGTRCYGFSCQGTLYRPTAFARSILPPEPPTTTTTSGSSSTNHPPICFVIGAMSTGHVTINDHPYIEKMVSISEYPLSGAAAISRLMGAIEDHWGVV